MGPMGKKTSATLVTECFRRQLCAAVSTVAAAAVGRCFSQVLCYPYKNSGRGVMTSSGSSLLSLRSTWLDWAQWQPRSCTQWISPLKQHGRRTRTNKVTLVHNNWAVLGWAVFLSPTYLPFSHLHLMDGNGRPRQIRCCNLENKRKKKAC